MNARTHLGDDACAALVLGLLPDEMRRAAELHLRECRECEARLRAHAGAAVRARADLAGRGAVPVPLPVTRVRRRNWWMSGIAAAAACVALFFAARMPSTRRAAAPAWLTPPGEIVHTRDDQPMDAALRSGFDAYTRHDLTAAIAALSSAHATGGAEQARRLYLGHALLASGRADEARRWLESLALDQLPEPWRAEAMRTLETAWRATGRTRQADSLARAAGR